MRVKLRVTDLIDVKLNVNDPNELQLQIQTFKYST